MIKKFSSYIFVFFLIVFIVGIFMSLYTVFFVMPETILHQVGISQTDQTKLEIAKLASFRPIILLTTELLLGLCLIVILIAHNKKFANAENIVYVTRTETIVKDADNNHSNHKGLHDQSYFQQQVENLKHHVSEQTESRAKLQIALNGLCNLFQATIGAVYIAKEIHSRRYIEFVAGYAFQLPESQTLLYEYGEGLAGQVAKDGKEINITHVPDGYITVVSGLGKSTPNNMIVLPILKQQQVVGVLEIASFLPFTDKDMGVAREIIQFIANAVVPEVKGVILSKN
jgi:putative methionine-R-sulfoxide reductase with GAF domain